MTRKRRTSSEVPAEAGSSSKKLREGPPPPAKDKKPKGKASGKPKAASKSPLNLKTLIAWVSEEGGGEELLLRFQQLEVLARQAYDLPEKKPTWRIKAKTMDEKTPEEWRWLLERMIKDTLETVGFYEKVKRLATGSSRGRWVLEV